MKQQVSTRRDPVDSHLENSVHWETCMGMGGPTSVSNADQAPFPKRGYLLERVLGWESDVDVELAA